MPGKGQFILVGSGSGAAGKTWLTIGLGACLADRGQRCLLVDGTWGFRGLTEQLALENGGALDAAMDGRITPEKALAPVRGGAGQGGFDVASCASGLEDAAPERVDRLVRTLKWFTSEYDFVLLDRPSGLYAEMIKLAARADHFILAVRDEPTSMTDAYAHLKVTYGYRPETAISLLVNRADTPELGQRCMTAMQKASAEYLPHIPRALGIVLADERAEEAARAHTAFPWMYPDSPASRALGKAADTLIADAATG